MPPDRRCQIEAREIHCDKGLVLRLWLSAALTNILTFTSRNCWSTQGLLETDHVILNHGQETWTTPQLAPPLLTNTPNHTNGRAFELSTDLTCIAALHGGSLVVLGWNSRQGQP
ncbi:hypothetical protein TNCV_3462091 [Trichonephila clavipes]|nr:hypothetical protein TNCV_3462091 [Trichonephila clavipes]